MSNKKLNRKLITLICILSCTFVVIAFNITMRQVKESTISSTTKTTSEPVIIKEVNSLKIEEEGTSNEVDNFADLKSNKLEVITVTKIEKQMRVNVKELNVRSETDSTNDKNIIGLLKKGDIVSVTGICDNDWIEIDYNGEVAYTFGEYLEDIE